MTFGRVISHEINENSAFLTPTRSKHPLPEEIIIIRRAVNINLDFRHFTHLQYIVVNRK